MDKEIAREEGEVRMVQEQYPAFGTLQAMTREALQEACRERQEQLAATVQKMREEWLHLSTRQPIGGFRKGVVGG